LRVTNWDAVAASAPLDATAATVRDSSGDAWEAKIPAHVNRWIAPPPMTPVEKLVGPAVHVARELIGRRVGRFLVLGIWAEGNPKKNATWVVRCDCGYYEGRKAKALRGPHAEHLACTACSRLRALQRQAAKPSTSVTRAASARLLDDLSRGGCR